MVEAMNEIVISKYSCRRINSKGYRVTIPAKINCAPSVQNNPILIKNSKARSHPVNKINVNFSEKSTK